MEQADALIRREMASLLHHDAAKFPMSSRMKKKDKKKRKRVPDLQMFDDEVSLDP